MGLYKPEDNISSLVLNFQVNRMAGPMPKLTFLKGQSKNPIVPGVCLIDDKFNFFYNKTISDKAPIKLLYHCGMKKTSKAAIHDYKQIKATEICLFKSNNWIFLYKNANIDNDDFIVMNGSLVSCLCNPKQDWWQMVATESLSWWCPQPCFRQGCSSCTCNEEGDVCKSR